MTISDQSRHQLHQRLDEVLGVDEAATLMEHLPPVGWADVATKRDLDHLGDRLRVEISGLRGEMHKEIGGLRAEMHKEIGEVHKEIGSLRGEMASKAQTLFLSLVGLQVTAAGLAVGLAKVL